MERVEFIKLMDPFAKFYKTKLDDFLTGMWFGLFKDVKPEKFEAALKWHLKNDEFNGFPAPGKITKAIDMAEEERINKKQDFPNFTTLWCKVIARFPEKENFPYYPPENNEEVWKALYDRLCRISFTESDAIITTVMEELENAAKERQKAAK